MQAKKVLNVMVELRTEEIKRQLLAVNVVVVQDMVKQPELVCGVCSLLL